MLRECGDVVSTLGCCLGSATLMGAKDGDVVSCILGVSVTDFVTKRGALLGDPECLVFLGVRTKVVGTFTSLEAVLRLASGLQGASRMVSWELHRGARRSRVASAAELTTLMKSLFRL